MPVALEVEAVTIPHQWADPVEGQGEWILYQRRTFERPHPTGQPGPRELAEGPGRSVHVDDLLRQAGQVDAHMPEVRCPRRDRQGQDDLVSHVGLEPDHGGGQVHLERPEHTGIDEWRENGHPVRDDRLPHDRGRRTHEASSVTARPSRRSLRAVTSAGGTAHSNTPWGRPSLTGTSGPVIPRTNRYATPPRWSAGR